MDDGAERALGAAATPGDGSGVPRVELEGLCGEYRLRPREAKFWTPLALVALAVINLALAVRLDRHGGVAVWSLFLVAWLVRVVLFRRPSTVVDAEGMRVSDGMSRPRLIRWEDIDDIDVNGGGGSYLRPRRGREVRLHGLPARTAQDLAAFVHQRAS